VRAFLAALGSLLAGLIRALQANKKRSAAVGGAAVLGLAAINVNIGSPTIGQDRTVVAPPAVGRGSAPVPTVTATNPPSGDCDDTATTANFTTKLASAANNSTLCLEAGAYGGFTTTSVRTGYVTVTPSPGVDRSAVTMAPVFSNARFMIFDGVTLNSAEIKGTAHSIKIKNSRFTQCLIIRASSFNNNNIIIGDEPETPQMGAAGDGNEWIDVPQCTGDGGIYMPSIGANPSGVHIIGNYIDGGESDGILMGAREVEFAYNEITGKSETGAHVDPIQLYGSEETWIHHNYIHDNEVAAGIMFPDESQSEIIEHNVIVQDFSDCRTLNAGGAFNVTIRHNTLIGCILLKESKPAQGSEPTNADLVRDNIVTDNIQITGGSTIAERSHNLVGSGATGSNDIAGQPTFVGGSSPTTVEGYALASGSLGENSASDGTDRGAIFP
jgi:hypothetical protein